MNPRGHIHHGRPRPRDAGDTLVELLVALAIISLCVVGLIGGLASAIASSGTHRNLTSLDSALKNFAELVRYDVQLQPVSTTSTPPTAPLFARCASTYLLAGAPNPSSGPVGTAVTVFGSGFSGNGTNSVSIGTTTINGAVTMTDTTHGNVTANFTVPPLPAGSYPITISDGGTATTSIQYTVTPWLGALSASSGPANTHVTVQVSGFSANATLTVTVGSSSPMTAGTTNTTGSNPPGAPLSFNIPNGLPNGPQTVVVSDGTNTARTTFTVGGVAAGPPGVGGTILSSSPLANYKIGIGGIRYWNGTSFTSDPTQCRSTSSPNNDIQQIILTGYAPGASDQLNTVVSNPQFVPTPTVFTQLSNSQSTPAIGGKLVFNATVTGPSGGPTPTGTITWQIAITSGQAAPTCAAQDPNNGIPYDPTQFNTSSGNSATATCVIYGANLTATTYTVTAVYNGDGNYNAASGTAVPITVPKGLQSISVQNPSPTPTYGQPIVFTATVTVPANAPAPQGTLSWTVSGPGPTTACNSTTPLQQTSPGSNSYTGTCKINSATVGTYTAQATISSDANYNGASAQTTLTVAPLPTTTSVVASPASSQTLGGTIQFTATVTGSGPPSLSGSVSWAGVTCTSQTFTISGTTGTAICKVTAATAGNYTATANYGGDPLYAPSSGSNSPAVVVSHASPSVTVTAAAANGSVTFTATVTGPAGGATPTGAGNWTVSGPSTTTCTGGSTALTATGNPPGTATATCVISEAKAGSYTVTYLYNGDANYNPASGSTNYTVAMVTPTVVISASLHGGKLTFTSTVTGTAGGPTPTGSGTWTLSGPGVSSCTGGTTALSGTGNPQGTATATCVVSSPAPAGAYTVTYAYPGDSNYNAANGSATFHVPKLTVTSSLVGTGNSRSLQFTATLNISPSVPAPNGSVSWAVSGSATSCTGGTTALAGSGTTYTATCTISNSKGNTYNATATFSGDSYYLPADTSLTGVSG